MTQKNVEILLGRLATDTALRQRFLRNPENLLATLRDEGLELSALELHALRLIDADAIQTFAGTLDRRLRKTNLDDPRQQTD